MQAKIRLCSEENDGNNGSVAPVIAVIRKNNRFFLDNSRRYNWLVYRNRFISAQLLKTLSATHPILSERRAMLDKPVVDHYQPTSCNYWSSDTSSTFAWSFCIDSISSSSSDRIDIVRNFRILIISDHTSNVLFLEVT